MTLTGREGVRFSEIKTGIRHPRKALLYLVAGKKTYFAMQNLLASDALTSVRKHPYRHAILAIKGKDLVGVEIGVAQGENAAFILESLSVKKLYLIDPYKKYEEYNDTGWQNVAQESFDENFSAAKRVVQEFGNKSEFIKKKSEDAVGDVPTGLDFVYIDGNHSYEFVKQDIELYYPKLKIGGVLCGDNFESIFPGVARAVLEFADEHGLKINGARWTDSYEWWVIKK